VLKDYSIFVYCISLVIVDVWLLFFTLSYRRIASVFTQYMLSLVASACYIRCCGVRMPLANRSCRIGSHMMYLYIACAMDRLGINQIRGASTCSLWIAVYVNYPMVFVYSNVYVCAPKYFMACPGDCKMTR
jgi:hypothetical protein